MDELISLAKAFSDKNRLAIVTLIQRESGLCVCEICKTLHLSQPLVSRHLRQLKASGVLTGRKEGKWAIYEITRQPSEPLRAWLTALKPYAKELGQVATCAMK